MFHPDIAYCEFFRNSFYEPNRKKEFLKFTISSQAPHLCNKTLLVSVKGIDTIPLFKARVKKIILNLDNEFSEAVFQRCSYKKVL